VSTLAVFGQVRNHDFVNFDDNDYVTENAHVKAGWTGKGVVWAFTTTFHNHWHPLTWLSHMTDCQFFGLDSGWHHLTNVFIHIANSLLLFLVFNKMTGDLWRSGFVAVLFALHPLHVESVAWASERKNVLSAFFWVLTMGSYWWYVKCPRITRYLFVVSLFVLGLMAKVKLVTLPFVLLLLDYWPLARFELKQPDGHSKLEKSRAALLLIWEKTPLFLILAAASVVAYLAQQGGQAFNQHPLDLRTANALVSYVSYIVKMIWPHHLAIFYPHPSMIPGWKVLGALAFLVSVSIMAIRAVRTRPYFAVGWLWYLGTLVPGIGMVQIGSEAMADRRAYVPIIGLFIIVAWGVPELIARWRYRRLVLSISTGIVLSVLMIVSWQQVRHWQNSVTLFTNALDVTTDNWLAHNNLGNALAQQGKLGKAITHYSEALRIAPGFAMAHNNLGFALAQQGRFDEAIRHYTKALKIDPAFAEAHTNLGNALASLGKFEEAISHCSEAVRIQPTNAIAHNNLGNALARQGHLNEAIEHFSEALRIEPNYAEGHYNLGFALAEQGRLEEAILHYTHALKIKPDSARMHNNLGIALARQGKFDEAIKHFSEALRIRPDFPPAQKNLRRVLRQAQQ
jgi:tetratricopeptide (TPR) repeat protein